MKQPPTPNEYRDTWAGDLRDADVGPRGPRRRLGPPPPRPRRPDLHRPARPLAARPARRAPRRRGVRDRRGAAARARRLRARQGRRARARGTVNPNLATGEIEIARRRDRPPRRRRDAAVPARRGRRRRRGAAPAVPLPRPAPRARCSARIALRHAGRRDDAPRARGARLPRHRDADPHEVHARGRARLPRAQPARARHVVRAAAVAAAVQAAADDRRLRALLPDRPLLPRRGPARRPPARVHPARRRDGVRHRGRRHRRRSRRVMAPVFALGDQPAPDAAVRAHAATTRRSRASAPTGPTGASASSCATSRDDAARRRSSRCSPGRRTTRRARCSRSTPARWRCRARTSTGSTTVAQRHGGKAVAWAFVTAEGWRSPIAKFFTRRADRRGRRARWRRARATCCSSPPTGARSRRRCSAACGSSWPTASACATRPRTTSSGSSTSRCSRRPTTAAGRRCTTRSPRRSATSTATRARCGSRGYDLICDGTELGGGSIRIHRADVQQKVLELLGMDAEEAQARFGFLLDALRYGAPPHGGIAFGIDRIVDDPRPAASSIRDVIAFPKTASGADPMTGAPSPVDEKQLRELGPAVRLERRYLRSSARLTAASISAVTVRPVMTVARLLAVDDDDRRAGGDRQALGDGVVVAEAAGSARRGRETLPSWRLVCSTAR